MNANGSSGSRDGDEWGTQVHAPDTIVRYTTGEDSRFSYMLGKKASGTLLARSTWQIVKLDARAILDKLYNKNSDLLCSLSRDPDVHNKALGFSKHGLEERYLASNGEVLNETPIVVVLTTTQDGEIYLVVDGYHRLLTAAEHWPNVPLTVEVHSVECQDLQKLSEEVTWDSLLRNSHSKVFPELRTPLFLELLRRLYIWCITECYELPSEEELTKICAERILEPGQTISRSQIHKSIDLFTHATGVPFPKLVRGRGNQVELNGQKFSNDRQGMEQLVAEYNRIGIGYWLDVNYVFKGCYPTSALLKSPFRDEVNPGQPVESEGISIPTIGKYPRIPPKDEHLAIYCERGLLQKHAELIEASTGIKVPTFFHLNDLAAHVYYRMINKPEEFLDKTQVNFKIGKKWTETILNNPCRKCRSSWYVRPENPDRDDSELVCFRPSCGGGRGLRYRRDQ